MRENSASSRENDDPADVPPLAGGLPALPERDPERIAFRLWNDGRVDEAIAFLEEHITAERQRRRQARASADAPPSGLSGWDATLEPASGWRERHRNALAPTDFNAYGAPASTIDVTPKRGDAILPERRSGRRKAWVMGLGLALVASAGAGLFWAGPGDRLGDEAILAAVGSETSPEAPLVEPDNAISSEGQVEVAAPQTEDAAADTPPPEMASANELQGADERAIAGAGDSNAPPPEMLSEGSGWDPIEPESTASITPAPEDALVENEAVMEARLPRQRPEPPAGLRSDPSETAVIEPVIVYDNAPNPQPVEPAPLPIFGQPFPRATLTPAEYQALLERRAWAQQYAAQRRAFAERQAEYAPPVILPPAYRLP